MKRILIVLLITGAFAACGDGGTQERINSESPDSTNNLPMTPDSSNIITDSAGGRNNPNSNQDSLRYN